MIVVTAAGGRTGAAVVRALWSRGELVRAVVGSCRPRPELTALGADVVSADLREAAVVEPLLDGADALYLIWPNFDPEETAGAVGLLAAARRAGGGGGAWGGWSTTRCCGRRPGRCPTMPPRTAWRRSSTPAACAGGSCSRAPMPTTSTGSWPRRRPRDCSAVPGASSGRSRWWTCGTWPRRRRCC